jgi:prepilin-type N-terminal cleavage/methylation domain-containing protein
LKTGFSLVEMTIAMAIVLVVMGAVFRLLDPAHGAFHAQPGIIDTQQRLRVAADSISRDLILAGAGGRKYFASVLPFRRGPLSPDSPAEFFDDRITILYVPTGAPRTTLSVSTDAGSAMYVNPQTECGRADPLCGFAVNALVAVFDETGMYDTFRISDVLHAPPALIRAGGLLSKHYAVGATVVEMVSATYWLRRNVGAGTSDLMKYDGQRTDLPVADHVERLTFEYYGDRSPPVLRRPPDDDSGPWTSYGPKPPSVNEDDPATPTYSAGENCLFTVVGGATESRLQVLGISPSLVRLERDRFTDGPWCPDPSAPNRFDADLLRVRRVHVTLRVRSQQITFDVTPRNLSLPQ